MPTIRNKSEKGIMGRFGTHFGRCFSEMKIVNRSQTFDNPVQSVYANVMNEDVERAVNGIIKES